MSEFISLSELFSHAPVLELILFLSHCIGFLSVSVFLVKASCLAMPMGLSCATSLMMKAQGSLRYICQHI